MDLYLHIGYDTETGVVMEFRRTPDGPVLSNADADEALTDMMAAVQARLFDIASRALP